MFSIVMPVIFLAMGGIPLPGGSTYVRRDLLRSRGWNSAVSLAGPAMNFLLFLGCALPLHPRFGWVDPLGEPSNAQIVFGCMAILQIISVILNLIPVPPLDGFQALSPWIPPDLRAKVSTPPLSTFLMIGFFLVLLNPHIFGWIMFSVVSPLLDRMGFDGNIDFIFSAFNKALFSR
jgi:Zn-dependent protease